MFYHMATVVAAIFLVVGHAMLAWAHRHDPAVLVAYSIIVVSSVLDLIAHRPPRRRADDSGEIA